MTNKWGGNKGKLLFLYYYNRIKEEDENID